MSTSKSHMYTANVWCCNMLNIIDVYFKVTHVYSKRVMLYYVEYNDVYFKVTTCIQQMCDVEYNRCLLQRHTCIHQMCDIVIYSI